MRRAQMTARTTGRNIERSMSGMSLRTSQAFAGMRVAANGLGLVLGAGLFVAQARAAFEFAAGLTETSRSIGVTVEQLQVLRRAAIENGASVEGMERAMSILNRTLGQARAGVPAAAQAFRALRIDPEQFSSAGEVLPRVMDSIRRLATQSEQAAAAQRLMGRGAAEMIPLLVQGSTAMDRWTQAAREAGLITEEQARQADEASDKLAILAVTLRTNLASALINIIPYIESAARALQTLGRLASSTIALIRSIPGGGAVTGAVGQQLGTMAMGPVLGVGSQFVASGRNALNRLTVRPGAAGAVVGRGLAEFAMHPRTPPPADTGLNNLDLSPGGGRRGGGNQAREKALREEAQFQSDMRRFRIDQLREQQQQTRDEIARGDLSQSILALEDEQYRADVGLAVALGDLTQARAAQKLEAHRQLVIEQGGTLALERSRTLLEEERDLVDQRFEIEADALRSQVDAAATAEERRRAELDLLDLTYRHQRAKLDEIILAERTTGHERDRAQQERNTLDASFARQRAGVLRGTRGPLGDFLAELPTTAARANEALQRVAAEGLQSITDGLVDAMTGVRSLGDVFKSIAQGIIADLLRIQIQRSITGPLANALGGLFGGTSKGGKGFDPVSLVSTFLGGGGKIPGRAAGGPVLPGRTYLIGEKGPELLRMGGPGQVISNDNLGGGGVVIHQTFAPNFAGNAATKQEMLHLAAMVKPMAQEAYRDMARRSR